MTQTTVTTPTGTTTTTTTKGWKSSEFAVAIVGALIPIANKYFGLHLDAMTITSIVGVLASYVLSRGLAKNTKTP